MTREDEAAIVTAWRAYTFGRAVDKATYLDFIDVRINTNARLKRVSVFEVLDLLTNLPAEEASRQSA